MELVLEVGELEPEPVVVVLCGDPDIVAKLEGSAELEGVEVSMPPHADVHVLEKLATTTCPPVNLPYEVDELVFAAAAPKPAGLDRRFWRQRSGARRGRSDQE